jgi:hypothetical protein
MLRIVKLGMLLAAFAVALIFVSGLEARQVKNAAAGPVPAEIRAGKKVFISNAGVDGTSLAAFKKESDPDKPYNLFYAAMKNWGRYELVADPADADLVFEIRFAAPFSVGFFTPQFDLAILDGKTHFRLWTLLEPVDGAMLQSNWDKNFSKGLANLMEDLTKLTSQPGAAAVSLGLQPASPKPGIQKDNPTILASEIRGSHQADQTKKSISLT